MLKKLDSSKSIEIKERTKFLIRVVKSEKIPINHIILFIIENWDADICDGCKSNKTCEYGHTIHGDEMGNTCFTSVMEE